jgi:hypothetical protein
MNEVKILNRLYRTSLTQKQVDELLWLEETTEHEKRCVRYMHERLTVWEECMKY